MKILLALMLTAASTTVLAKTTLLVCDETKSTKGQHERFEILLNEKKQILDVTDITWNDKTNKKAGNGSASYTEDKALKPELVNNTLIYRFTYQNEGDVDYPGPVTDVVIMLDPELVGEGEITVAYDDGHSGSEYYIIQCKKGMMARR